MENDTLFSKIIRREIPADIVYEDDECICIKDIAPQAPVHVLLIPKKPIPKISDATPDDKALLGHLMTKVAPISEMLGISDAFRVIINNGEKAGQTVFHLHLHLLGGKNYTEQGLGF